MRYVYAPWDFLRVGLTIFAGLLLVYVLLEIILRIFPMEVTELP